MRFTIWQATLSTFISVGLAIPVARAFARQPYFKGRHALLQLMSLPVVMPVIVAVLGVIAVYGQSGMLHDWLKPLGISWIGKFYGLPGILVAHVFFNLPLSVRLLLPAWDRIPCENWRLAAQLDMNSRQLFRWLEGPSLTGVLPGTITVFLLLRFSSFAVVLVLGGGPASTTIEVAIYQALRFEFDPGQAALFALGQLTICTAIVLGMHRWIPAQSMSHGLITSVKYRPDQGRLLQRSFDLVLITLTGLFVALPLSAVILAGITG
ncbi:MAG: thiamine/thiamine pyrophosphate ABC transporter permease ThiP, partial [Gammaproteobacteria bacterium]|nr:thiamine/thiamine pyrophosphate ABC transporter permease ThiP [Gammaproteobacteria bacterium]